MSQDARRDEELTTERRASVLGMNYSDTSKLEHKLFKDILSTQELYSFKAIPLMADEHNIHFGITTTTSQQTLNQLKNRFSDQRVGFSIISDTGYQDYLKLYNPPKQVIYEDMSLSGIGDHSQDMVSQVSATLDQVRPDDMLAYLVQQAYELKASDIHLENQRENIRVRFRVDGVLHPVAFISREKYRHLSSALASAANVSTDANDAQQGHISKNYKMATGEDVVLNLRVETVPAVYGMDVVMRLFNLKLELFKLENLQLSSKESEVVQDIIKRPTGMVLIVGPTGSGKTTTLYSIINTLNTPERKIITLEDPVEYNMPGVVQIPVAGSLQTESFVEKLRAVLRLDPDVVMVGEIRDKDTAKTALQGALTGHLVLSTFHASSAAAALSRMLDLIGINPLFSSAMRLIMAQRLVRLLDERTRVPFKPDDNLKAQLKTVINTFPPGLERPNLDGVTLYRAGSSAENPFGYNGVTPIREQMVMTPGVQKILSLPPNEVTTEMLEAKAVEDGMRTMLHDGIIKALSGITTLDEVYRVIG